MLQGLVDRPDCNPVREERHFIANKSQSRYCRDFAILAGAGTALGDDRVPAVPSDTSALFSEHRRSLVDYATGIVGSRAQAEDVVQEAFIRFAPVQRSDVSIEQPLAYLYRIVRNLALDSTRRKSLEQRQCEQEPVWWMVPPTPRTPEQELRHRQNLEEVEKALRTLPKEARLAVEMHRLGGYTLQEVADHLDLSVATVHRMVRDALVRIGGRMTLRDLQPPTA